MSHDRSSRRGRRRLAGGLAAAVTAGVLVADCDDLRPQLVGVGVGSAEGRTEARGVTAEPQAVVATTTRAGGLRVLVVTGEQLLDSGDGGRTFTALT